MKKLNLLFIAVALVAFAVSSCGKGEKVKPKTEPKLSNNYPTVLNSIVTPDMIDTLKKHGLVINAGTTPPVVDGVFLQAPDICIYDNATPANAGKLFTNYEYQFLNQDNSKYTVTVNYSNAIVGADDSGTDGSATYIAGQGNLFTVFAEVTGTLNGVTYKELQVLTGELAPTGLKNFQWAFLMKSKTDDPGDHKVAKVGTIRIFNDKDGFSEKQATFTTNSFTQNLMQKAIRQDSKPIMAASTGQN